MISSNTTTRRTLSTATARYTMGMTWMAATALLALSGCNGAISSEGATEAETESEPVTAATQALGGQALTDAEAVEAVRAVCVGAHKNHGECVDCVAGALLDLRSQGQITVTQYAPLLATIGASECHPSCMATSCAIEGASCGAIPDGCGGTLECGGCPGFLSCGAGGTPNACGCDVAPEVCDGVDRDCDGRWDTEVPSICPTIQSALDVAHLPGTIRVAPGLYGENVNFKGAPVTVLATGGASVTTIDAGQSGPAVTINHGEGPQSILDGFTLTNGTGAPGWPGIGGGGLFIDSSSPTLRHLVVEHNTVATVGGHGFNMGAGAYITQSSPTISSSVFTDNHAEYYGGGLFLDRSYVHLDHVVIDGNTATYGAGIGLYYGSVTVDDAVLSSNSGYSGNGAFLQGGMATFTNVSMVHNTGRIGGAVSSYGGATVALVNVTMSDGAASDTTGGAYAYPDGAISFDHCNLWNNAGGDVGGVTNPIGADGNIAVAPGFVDTSAPASIDWDLHLVPMSLLRHAGTPALQNQDASVSDIGAYGGPGGSW